MKSIFLSSILLLLSTVHANESSYQRDNQSEDRGDKDDAVAYESFDSPVYGGPKGMPAPGKGYPLPAAPAIPAGYALPPAPAGYALPAAGVPPAPYTTYLNSLGSNAASPYNRYSSMPYAALYGYGAYGAPYGAYGAPYGAYGAPYGAYGSPYAGYGYPAGLSYGNPSMLGRSAAAYNTYPGYAGLGYRFGGLGYNAGAFRGQAVPVAGVPAVPAAGIPAYAAPAVPVASKGNALPYGYALQSAQKLPAY